MIRIYSFVFLMVFFCSITFAQVSNIDGMYGVNTQMPVNYIKNKGCYKNTANITASGGSLSRNTTTPLENGADCAIDASASGQTYSWATFSFDRSLAGANCEARFIYKGDASLYKAYANVNSVKVTADLQLSNASDARPVSINFPCGAQPLTSAVVIESTSASAATINVSNVYAGIATNLTNDFSTAPTSWTPTGSWSTNTTYTGKRQITERGTVVYDILVTTGGLPTSASLTINLPSGDVIDTARLTDGSTANFNLNGSVDANDSGGSAYPMGAVRFSTTTAIQVYINNSSSTYSTVDAITQAVPFTFGAGDKVHIQVELPIVGIASQTAIKLDCALDGSCINTFSAEIDTASSCAVSKENVDWITSTSSGGAGICTMTFKSGLFSLAPVCIANGVYYPMGHGINAGDLTASYVIIRSYNYSTGVNTATTQRLVCFRASSDVKPNINAPILVGSVTSSSSKPLRTEAAVIGTTSTTACTASPCGYVEQFDSNFISSVTRTSAGIYVLNFPAGTWATTPMCTCSGGGVTASLSCRSRYAAAAGSTTALELRMTTDAGGLTDEMVNVQCTGRRL